MKKYNVYIIALSLLCSCGIFKANLNNEESEMKRLSDSIMFNPKSIIEIIDSSKYFDAFVRQTGLETKFLKKVTKTILKKFSKGFYFDECVTNKSRAHTRENGMYVYTNNYFRKHLIYRNKDEDTIIFIFSNETGYWVIRYIYPWGYHQATF
jgi:hypothetical protein